MARLVFHPETFVFYDDSAYLLYNSATHRSLECRHTVFTDRIFAHLSKLTNLYQVDVGPEELAENAVLIGQMNELGLAELFGNKDDAHPSYAPILNLNYDFDALEKLHESNEDYYLLGFLHEITFFITPGQQLDAARMLSFMDKAYYCNIRKVNLVASSTGDLDAAESFIRSLTESYPIVLFIKTEGIPPQKILEYAHRIPDAEIRLVGSVDKASPILKDFPYDVLVGDEASLRKLDGNPDIKINRILPFINADQAFLRKHLRIEKEGVFCAEKNDIFIRQTLNPHFFGKLFVFPDGTVSDSPAGVPLGKLDELIHTLIRREIDTRGSWFFTRDKTPCRSCRFKYLCPSPSIYEIQMNEYDTCFLSTKCG